MTMEKNKKIKKLIINDMLFFVGIFAFVILCYFILGVNCPIKFFFKFDCPFCGMTRAHLAALRFDFKTAFEYHPLFFLGVPYIFLLIHNELFKGKWKLPYNICIWTLTGMFLICYIIRLILSFVDI